MNQLIKIILSALGALPMGLRVVLGRTLGMLFSLLPTRDRKIIKLQSQLFLPPESLEKFRVWRVYASLGQTLFEALNLNPYLKNVKKYVDADWPEADRIISTSPGIVTLSAHTGNWELLAASMTGKGMPISVVGRQARNAGLQEILSGIRAGYGVKTLWRGGSLGTKEIINSLKQREMVGALIDQDTRVTNSLSSFMDNPAWTPSSICALGSKLKTTIVSAFIFRTGFMKYRIFVDLIPADLPVEEIVLRYNTRLSSLIKEFPDQWVWFHKRWRTRPEGARLSSSEYLAFLENEIKRKCA